MSTSPVLGVPFLAAQQQQPEVLHNAALLLLQATQVGVKAILDTPPIAPDDGDAYIVGPTPTGAWSGRANAIAVYYSGWKFIPDRNSDGSPITIGPAQAGLRVWLLDDGQSPPTAQGIVWDGAAWREENALFDAPSDGSAYGRRNASWLNLDLRYLDFNSSQTIPGAKTFEQLNAYASNAIVRITLNGSAGYRRQLALQTSAVDRFLIGLDNSAESSGNAGSSFSVQRCNDAGTVLDTPIYINRANGRVVLTNLAVTSPTVPASAAASGSIGQIAWDANYIYVCVATNTWKRSAISTW